MRIPLDYYRILGLPTQATAEQLQQAHRDRTLQLPRREYSEAAINARKQLIDEAYGVLSVVDKRQEYDKHFLAKSYAAESTVADPSPGSDAEISSEAGEEALRSLATEPTAVDAYTPTIDIDDRQLVGALLILLELGEYELVIRLGRPYLSSGHNELTDGRLGNPKEVLSDIVLSLALACLELGREQWQQRQYENAAESLETGHELLLREGAFSTIRADIQSDLYKLRPYRVLELISLPLDQIRERRQGIQLLKRMLQDRGGIDGNEDDLSGLSIDDFLRFIQQLRSYLTAAEQQELFEGEARRPSAVAVYLAIYALLARGFAHHQPALIRRAKQLLMRLGNRQDVHLEQAVCALLLGQTEEASRALEFSQEYESLAFIREHSQTSPDLLPGLCLYAEKWLQQEVFPHFRDLAQQQTTLKDYFADEQVQAYLESMPSEPSSSASTPSPWVTNSAASTSSVPPTFPSVAPDSWSPPRTLPPESPRPGYAAAMSSDAVPTRSAVDRSSTEGAIAPSVAERISQLSPEGQLQPSHPTLNGNQDTYGRNGYDRSPSSSAKVPASQPPAAIRGNRGRRFSPRWGRLITLFVIGMLSMGVLGFASMRLVSWIGGLFLGPKIDGEPLAIQLANPPIPIPDPATATPQVTPQQTAEAAIQAWFAAKSAAFGEDHQIDQLNSALIDPLLSQWRQRAQEAQENSWSWEYDHELTVMSVEPDSPDATELKVKANVRESAKFYEWGRLNASSSYDEALTMQYDLVKLDTGEWRIRSVTKLN